MNVDPEKKAKAALIEARIEAVLREETADGSVLSHGLATRALVDALIKHFDKQWVNRNDPERVALFERFLGLVYEIYTEGST